MKRLCFLLGILFFIASCGTLPKIQRPDSRMHPEEFSECRRPFLPGRWQFQHAIEAALSDGRKSILIGVSVISPESVSIRSVLMTIEGLVVFDAEYDRNIRIMRAVSPFNSDHFARGLINALRLMFFMPEGDLIETGRLPDGDLICRYQSPDKQVVDVVKSSDRHWQVQQYNRFFRKKRTVDIFFNDNFRLDEFHVPNRLKLVVRGYYGYTLDLDLIEAVLLKDQL